MQQGQSCASVNTWGTSYLIVFVHWKKSFKIVTPACLEYSQTILNTACIVTCQDGDGNGGEKRLMCSRRGRTNTGGMVKQAKQHKDFASFQVVSLLVLECHLD